MSAFARARQALQNRKQNGSGGIIRTAVRWMAGTVKTSLAVAGAVTIGVGYMEYRRLFPREWDEEDYRAMDSVDSDDPMMPKTSKKKKVLVLPFHRLQLLEHRTKDWSSQLSRNNSFWSPPDDDRIIQMETRELVEALHHAASDPSIVAAYGVFGHGGVGITQAGWGDLEEVRNALRVFRESHRRHAEPNLQHAMQVIPRQDSKPMYAYSDTFASLADPANKEYYLASMFTHVHMQKSGELNLLGMLSTQFFLRGFLEKYGIQVHVFKHGLYKNAPNMFTETHLNKQHKENVTNILQHLNADICQDISMARSKALLTHWLVKDKRQSPAELWKRIHESGTFPALTAWKAGLIDYLPRRDPLPELVKSNEKPPAEPVVAAAATDVTKTANENSRTDQATTTSSVSSNGKILHGTASTTSSSSPLSTKEAAKAAWGMQETDFERFQADEIITLQAYARKLQQQKRRKERLQQWDHMKERFGLKPKETKPEKEHIALVHVTGMIGDTAARKVIKTIRKIRNDSSTKCVVLRVSSPGGSIFACESILQEIKSLTVPVVYSFGNVSASGGYYIASGGAADRIFANKKTITGSIGVFAIRPDFTGLLKQYGIKVEHVAAGDLSASFNPFHPITRKMKQQIAVAVDRYYAQFKGVVAEGRNMTPTDVEAVAQGRVWTGEQAKWNGLVDELGGLHRAIAYARRTHCSPSVPVEVVEWPKSLTWRERLAEARQQQSRGKEDELSIVVATLREFVTEQLGMSQQSNTQEQPNHVNLFVNQIVNKILHEYPSSTAPGSLAGGIVFAADENTAIRLLFEQASNGQQQPLPKSVWESN